MTISERIEDARFLRACGRPVGALTMLIVAVAASSRKRFPSTTISIRDPSKLMGDGEAFRLFIGGRLHDLVFRRRNRGSVGPSGLSVAWEGSQKDISWILYKYYRNGLLHEGTLNMNARFEEGRAGAQALEISVEGDTISFGHGLLDFLERAVIEARCNGPEFGLTHYDLESVSGRTVEEESARLATELGTITGRITILSDIVVAARDLDIASTSAERVSEVVRALGVINGGAATALASEGFFCRKTASLTEAGVAALRHVASAFRVVRVTE